MTSSTRAETAAHRKSRRKAYYEAPTATEPRRYYVVQWPMGPIISSIHGGIDSIAGPVTLVEAVNAYIKAGGLANDLDFA